MADKLKVLITTSGIGSRLGEITNYTNKALVKIGKRPAISYVVEAYPFNTEYVVCVGHFADHVKQYLKLAYPNRSFTFVEVDNYDGPGSSLAYSQLCAKEHLQCPFIYNACDTIILDERIPNPHFDWVGGYAQPGSSQYDSYVSSDGYVRRFYSKGHIDSDHAYIGLIGVHDFKSYWDTMQEMYDANPNNRSLSDFYCRKLQLDAGKDIAHVGFKWWYDIGNVESLQHARATIPDSHHILDKLEESIFIVGDHVIKFFADPNMVNGRVLRSHELRGLVPEVVASTLNYYKYKYVVGDLYSEVATPNGFDKLLTWADERLWTPVEFDDGYFKGICRNFYEKKTHARLKKFYSENNMTDHPSVINGVYTVATSQMLDQAMKIVLRGLRPTNFHGDFILDNIIRTEDVFKLLDWRQDFGEGNVLVGDMYYDLAKLNHNLVINHEIINRNLFTIKKVGAKVTLDIHRRQNLVDCQEVLHRWIVNHGYDLTKVKVLTAIIWLNMAPLHHHPFGEFLYHFGRYNLQNALLTLETSCQRS